MAEFKRDFADVVNYLLSRTFIIADNDRARYNFCRNIDNRNALNDYLYQMGYQVNVYESIKIAALEPIFVLLDDGSFMSPYRKRFPKIEQLMFFTLKEFYLSEVYKSKVSISAVELRKKMLSRITTIKKADFESALRDLRWFNIIGFTDDPGKDDFPIVIYGSVMSIGKGSKLAETIEAFSPPSEGESENELEIKEDEDEVYEEEMQ